MRYLEATSNRSGHEPSFAMVFLAATVITLSAIGCGDDQQDGTADLDTGTDIGDAGENGEADPVEPMPNPDCDPLMEAECALPWPSNLYLVADTSRDTGYTLTFGSTSLPYNYQEIHVDPQPYRRMDGYSLGTPLIVLFPNLDISQMATEIDLAPSVEDDAQIVWLEVGDQTVSRVPYWVELDAFEPDPAKAVLFVRPAVILHENTRYVVAMRGLVDTQGNPFEPSEAFAKLRSGETAGDSMLEPRQARFDEMFSILEDQDVDPESLTLAWDFHTASSDALHGRMLHMIDDAFEVVGEDGPSIEIETVTQFQPTENGTELPVDQYIALEMEGTMHVPHYMEELENGYVGYVFHLGEDGLPEQDGWRDVPFWVRIPYTALDGTPHGLVQYGHGLLGSGTQVRSSFNGKIAYDHHLIFFACDLVGMSEYDEAGANLSVFEMSWHVWMGDRLHQGMLEYLLLARAMRERFPDLSDVTERNIVVNTDELFYSGISQGGIFGHTYMALSPDVTYGHLGVPGNNYSLLLYRSTDFDRFFDILQGTYARSSQRAILLSTIQLLWDGTDPVSYIRHITAEPFEGNDPHYVLIAPAIGDYQVAPVSNEVTARSDVEVPIMAHYGRELWGITEQSYPYTGSGIVMYDFGNPWAPPGNQPPQDELGDPHELPRRQDHHNLQMVTFLRTGEIVDVCGGDGCTPQ